MLKGGDLRSIGKSNDVAAMVTSQEEFDQLFVCMKESDRIITMRAADAIEKISSRHPGYLQKYKPELLDLCEKVKDIELKWHLALLVSRLELNQHELEKAWNLLSIWAIDNKESKIVRVNSIQGLFNLLSLNPELISQLKLILTQIEKENIASLNARIRKIRSFI